MSIYQEYYDAQKELESKYGKQSVVLMQVGSFYEAYGVNLPNKKPPIKIGHTEKVSEVLSMQIAYKNGRLKPHSKKNPQMVGFPDYALGNHLAKLIKAGFTIAVYDQFEPEEGTKKDRKLINIYSASTYIDEEINDSNALMVIGTGHYRCPISKQNIEFGRCVILDLKTGEVDMTEIYNAPNDNKKVETELYRIIHTFNPCEIIYSGNIDEIENRFDLTNKKTYNIQLVKAYKNLSYQNQFLKKVYHIDTDLSSPVEILGLAKYSNLIPYFIQGLQYAFEHDPLIISKIKQPCILNNDEKLILNNDSIYQLHLIEQNSSVSEVRNSKFKSLFGILNKTRTPMGKRLLRSRLLMPTTNIDILEDRYAKIAELKENYEEYDTLLRGMADVDKKYRKMVLKRLHPYELANLQDTFISIQKILEKGQDTFNIDQTVIDEFNKFCQSYENTFDHSRLQGSKLGQTKNSYFKEKVCAKVDKIQKNITSNSIILNELAKKLSDVIDKKNIAVKIEYNMNDKHHLKTTRLRFAKVKKTFNCTLSDGTVVNYENFKVNKLKNTVKISSDFILATSRKITKAQFELGPTITTEYFAILDKWEKKWGQNIMTISRIIAEIDFTMNAAKVAKEYDYYKPVISNEQNGRSFLSATALRHPIVERIVTTTNYVSNDVEIGSDGHYGTILYGVNMSGKSSLLRSIGTAVVMAQAGMFVAAENFIYYPFHSIISKITVQDNPFKGQSLFMVEMEEVNNMLRRANENSLVLSDELCSSTETSSAHAIVACTLKKLAEMKVNFIFSTHLHELQKIPVIINNQFIQIMHFKVRIKDGEMIFDRHLQNGGIPDTYGLEIAGALGLPKEFMKEAFEIRDFLKQEKREILSTKHSGYNKDVFMHQCALCGTNKALETHHILFQCTANKNGIIKNNDGPIHKNQQFNLIVVCRDCHIRIHKKEFNLKVKKLRVKI